MTRIEQLEKMIAYAQGRFANYAESEVLTAAQLRVNCGKEAALLLRQMAALEVQP